jgi:hypothetical protein
MPHSRRIASAVQGDLRGFPGKARPPPASFIFSYVLFTPPIGILGYIPFPHLRNVPFCPSAWRCLSFAVPVHRAGDASYPGNRAMPSDKGAARRDNRAVGLKHHLSALFPSLYRQNRGSRNAAAHHIHNIRAQKLCAAYYPAKEGGINHSSFILQRL